MSISTMEFLLDLELCVYNTATSIAPATLPEQNLIANHRLALNLTQFTGPKFLTTTTINPTRQNHMIPQAVANVGPYADLWSYLKSMQHALDRALGAQNAKDLSDLDKERLNTLARFLKSELSQKTAPDSFTFAGFGGQPSNEPTYSLDIDFPQMLKNLPVFEEWHAPQKLGFDKKWQRLVAALESYAQSLGGSLLPGGPPREEFQILQKIVSELLVHAESALQT